MKDDLATMALRAANFLFIDDLEQKHPAIKAACLLLRAVLASCFLFGGVVCLTEGAMMGWALRIFVGGFFLATGGWVLAHAIRLVFPDFLERKRR